MIPPRKKMLTEQKLLSLKENTRLRKISMILSQNAHDIKTGKTPDWDYLDMVIAMAGLEAVPREVADSDPRRAMLILQDYAGILLARLGSEPSDWDITDSIGNLDVSKRLIQDKILILDRLRSPYNVGAVFRSADSFGVKKIILIEETASPDHPHARRTSRGCTDTVDWQYMTEEEAVSYLSSCNMPVLALELGGEDINTYKVPPCGVAILGNEEFGISPALLKCCTDRITINTAGTKGSLNVSVAAGILLQRWF